jgi:hypothetical protein
VEGPSAGMAQAARNKYWGVATGRQTGIFTTWAGSHAQVNGFSGHSHGGFQTLTECVLFLMENGQYSSEDEINVHIRDTTKPLLLYKHELSEQIRDQESILDTLSTSHEYFSILFCHNIERVFQYDMAEVTEFLTTSDNHSLDTLLETRLMLFGTLHELFPNDFTTHEMYNRRKLETAAEDIYVIGYSIVNTVKDKRLSKVFKTPLNSDVTIVEPKILTAPLLDDTWVEQHGEQLRCNTESSDELLVISRTSPNVTLPNNGRDIPHISRTCNCTSADIQTQNTATDLNMTLQSVAKLTFEVQKLVQVMDKKTDENTQLSMENASLNETVAKMTKQITELSSGHGCHSVPLLNIKTF